MAPRPQTAKRSLVASPACPLPGSTVSQLSLDVAVHARVVEKATCLLSPSSERMMEPSVMMVVFPTTGTGSGSGLLQDIVSTNGIKSR